MFGFFAGIKVAATLMMSTIPSNLTQALTSPQDTSAYVEAVVQQAPDNDAVQFIDPRTAEVAPAKAEAPEAAVVEAP